MQYYMSQPKIYAARVEVHYIKGEDEQAKNDCIAALRCIVPTKDEPHEHTLRVCPVCGQLTWMQSTPAKEESFKLDYQTDAWNGPQTCDDCNDACSRNPELWVQLQRAIHHALLLERKKAITDDQ